MLLHDLSLNDDSCGMDYPHMPFGFGHDNMMKFLHLLRFFMHIET